MKLLISFNSYPLVILLYIAFYLGLIWFIFTLLESLFNKKNTNDNVSSKNDSEIEQNAIKEQKLAALIKQEHAFKEGNVYLYDKHPKHTPEFKQTDYYPEKTSEIKANLTKFKPAHELDSDTIFHFTLAIFLAALIIICLEIYAKYVLNIPLKIG